MNFENLDESFCQNLWDLKITVVQVKQSTEQLYFVINQSRCDAEYMTENKILGSVVPHSFRRILALGIKYRVQHAPVDLLDNRVAQVWKDVPQVE